MDIAEAVKKIQIDRGLNDTQVAELLGYKHRTGWARIKSGVVPANEVFKLRAWKAFTPELNAIGHESLQDGGRRGVKRILDKIVLKVRKYL